MIKTIIKNEENAVEISFPCTEKELSETLCKVDLPNMIPAVAYVNEILEPKELFGIAGKYINLDEINYFAKFSENLSEEDQRKLYSIILIEKCKDTKNLINLYFKGLCCNFCFEKLAEIKTDFFNGKTFPVCAYDSENFLISVGLEYQGENEYLSLPCESISIAKAVQRLGALNVDECQCSINDYRPAMRDWIKLFENFLNQNDIYKINDFTVELCEKQVDIKKLVSFMEYAGENSLESVKKMADHINDFNYIDNIRSYEELGMYLVQKYFTSGIPCELQNCIEYRICGENFADQHEGRFIKGGFAYLNEGVCLSSILAEEEGIKLGEL